MKVYLISACLLFACGNEESKDNNPTEEISDSTSKSEPDYELSSEGKVFLDISYEKRCASIANLVKSFEKEYQLDYQIVLDCAQEWISPEKPGFLLESKLIIDGKSVAKIPLTITYQKQDLVGTDVRVSGCLKSECFATNAAEAYQKRISSLETLDRLDQEVLSYIKGGEQNLDLVLGVPTKEFTSKLRLATTSNGVYTSKCQYIKFEILETTKESHKSPIQVLEISKASRLHTFFAYEDPSEIMQKNDINLTIQGNILLFVRKVGGREIILPIEISSLQELESPPRNCE